LNSFFFGERTHAPRVLRQSGSDFRRLAEANFTKIGTKQGAFFAANSANPTNKDR